MESEGKEDKVETKLLWFFLTFILILAWIVIFIFMIFVSHNSQNEGVPNKSRFMQNKTERFGIATQEDIYIDNMENGKYTKHGRLITKSE
jgi:energy-coupling factor transporter transmembrane protein EcfT